MDELEDGIALEIEPREGPKGYPKSILTLDSESDSDGNSADVDGNSTDRDGNWTDENGHSSDVNGDYTPDEEGNHKTLINSASVLGSMDVDLLGDVALNFDVFVFSEDDEVEMIEDNDEEIDGTINEEVGSEQKCTATVL